MLSIITGGADKTRSPLETGSRPALWHPEKAARIHIEKINELFLYKQRGTPAEYGAGLKLAIERGWLGLHESGTYVKFTQPRVRICLPKPRFSR